MTAWQLKREGGGNNTSIPPTVPWHPGQAGFPDFFRGLTFPTMSGWIVQVLLASSGTLGGRETPAA